MSEDKSRVPFVVQKISNHGASNPIVARLTLQTFELVKFLHLKDAEKTALIKVYVDLHRKLLQCHEIRVRLRVAHDNAMRKYIAELRAGNRSLPYAISLDSEAEAFLFASKQYLRDLVKVINILFGTKFPVDSKIFWDPKRLQKSELIKWAEQRFGIGDPHTEMFRSEDEWIAELIMKRNAAEHPGEKSGTLVFENFVFSKDGALIRPTWRREGKTEAPRTDVLVDVNGLIDNMLTLAEDLLAMALLLHPQNRVFQIAEIPVEERKPEAPVRFQLMFKPEFIKHDTVTTEPAPDD